MRSTSPVQVRVVDSERDLAALGPEWERLQSDAEVTSIFNTFEWMHLWWKFYGRKKPLRVLVATSGSALVGVVPLYIDTVDMLRFPVRLLRLVGTGGDTYPDYLGAVLARGREAEVARALAEKVLRLDGWDVLLLTDMDPACAFTQAIESVTKKARLMPRRGRSERIAYLDLPATWDAWLQSMHRDKRYRIKNVRKKLNAAHPTKFFIWNDPNTIDQGVDRLIHLHHKRWKDTGQSHAFATPEYRDFHRATIKALLQRDRLRLYCLELSGQVVAMYYFYKFRDRVYLMQSGFDPDFSDVKPGQALLGYVVESAISEGHKVLDFLRGEHRYKDELSSGERETVYVTAFRLRPGALVYRARRLYLPKLKAYLLQQLKKVRPEPRATE